MPIGIAELDVEPGVLQTFDITDCAPVEAPSPRSAPPDGAGAGDHLVCDPLPTALLIDIAVGLAEVPGLWQGHLGDGSEHRAVRLLATSSYEAWVVSWADDGLVDVHDHGDSSGAVVVVAGALRQLDGHGRHRRTLERGTIAHLPVGAPHDLLAEGPEPAASIHVFSPPLSTLGTYDADGARRGEEPVCPAPAVHDAASYVRAREQHRRPHRP